MLAPNISLSLFEESSKHFMARTYLGLWAITKTNFRPPDKEAEGEDNGVHSVYLCKDRDAVEKQALSCNVSDRKKRMTLRRTVKAQRRDQLRRNEELLQGLK